MQSDSSGWIDGGRGSQVLVGEAAKLYEDIDRALTDQIRRSADAEPTVMPTMLSITDLEIMGYTTKFEKHVTIGYALSNPAERVGLSPAACLALYPAYQHLQRTGPTAFTSRVKVFRFEGGDHHTSRRWEFNVREVVFIGSEDFVRDSLAEAARWGEAVLNEFNIAVSLEPASDYFTGEDRKTEIMRKLQLREEKKKEFVSTSVIPGTSLGSINFHGSLFSKQFGWDNNGTVVSGCVGFGLERITLLAQSASMKAGRNA